MNRKPSLGLTIFTVSLVFVGISFILLWDGVNKINSQDYSFVYPTGRIEVFMFLSRSFFLLTPFLLGISIAGTYLVSKVWVKNVVINVMKDNYDKQYISNRMKHLSDEEKNILSIMISKKPEILQSELVKESKLSAYKVTRILNRFEERELIRREKHGITNIIYLLFDPESIAQER